MHEIDGPAFIRLHLGSVRHARTNRRSSAAPAQDGGRFGAVQPPDALLVHDHADALQEQVPAVRPSAREASQPLRVPPAQERRPVPCERYAQLTRLLSLNHYARCLPRGAPETDGRGMPLCAVGPSALPRRTHAKRC